MTARQSVPDGPPVSAAAAVEYVRPRHTYSSRQVFPAVAAIITAISVLLWLPVLRRPTVTGLDAWQIGLGAVILIAAFVACELFPLKVEVSRETLLVSLSEFPLVLGLLVLPVWVAGASHLIAGSLVYLFRRDNWRNSALNLSLIAVEAGAGALAVTMVGTTQSTQAVHFAAAALGVLAGALISAVSVGVAYWFMGTPEPLVRVVTRSMLAATFIVTFALVAYVLWRASGLGNSWFGPLLCLVLGLVLIVLYRTYFTFLRQHADLARMYAFGRTVTTVGTETPSWKTLVEEVRDQLNATAAVLHLTDEDGVTRTMAVGPEGDRAEPAVVTNDALLDLARTTGGAQVATDRTSDEQLLQALGRREAWDVLVVPLRSGERDKGFLEVRDRRSRWGRFRDEDLQLLQTLGGQVATALDNVGLMQTLRHEAYHDPVTGLLNRLGLTVEAQERLRAGRLGGMLLVQLDVLSEVNNAIGHERGSQLLTDAGQRLIEVAGPDRLVARIEMDRFAVLFGRQSEAEIVAVAGELLTAASQPYRMGGIEVDPAAEAGLALAPREDPMSVDPSALLQRAEMAMLAATDSERSGGLQIYRPSMGEVFRRRFQLVTQFRQAVESGRIVVHYQPKLSLQERELVGVEALVRWMHPEFGLVSPAEFVQAIEATGSIDILLSHVLDVALNQVRSWTARDMTLGVAVNLSARNLLAPDFANSVAAALAKHGVPAELLTFEITESSVMAEPEHSLPVLRDLHAMGIQLSVDDFGTGYSSLAYLRRLPIDEIKIDRSFVQGMVTDLGDMAIVRAIIDLGHSLGLRVVAEGVEEEAARDSLRSMRCDNVQGFLLSRPLPVDRFEAWLASRTVRTTPAGSPGSVLRLVG